MCCENLSKCDKDNLLRIKYSHAACFKKRIDYGLEVVFPDRKKGKDDISFEKKRTEGGGWYESLLDRFLSRD